MKTFPKLSLLLPLFLLGACGGTSSSSKQFNSGPELASALTDAQLPCTGYKTTPKADWGMGQEGAIEVGECDLEGESIELTIWKDSAQRKNYEGLGKTLGCAFGKAFGISSFDYVNGGLWTIGNATETLSKQIAEQIGAEAVHHNCE